MPSIDTKLEYDGYPHALGLWVTTTMFEFTWRGRTYFIPPGMVSDFFSIPRIFRFWRANNRGHGNEPALIHDWLLRFRHYFGLSVMDCHRAFRDFMEILNFGTSGRAKYKAVVIGGWAFPGDGDGRPPRKERRAMLRNGDSWERYRDRTAQANQPGYPS